jgi:hypothetical protein
MVGERLPGRAVARRRRVGTPAPLGLPAYEVAETLAEIWYRVVFTAAAASAST